MSAPTNRALLAQPDIDLIRQTAAGNLQSLSELHERYASVLHATAYRILHNAADAEDVVQEAFVQIWQKAAMFDLARGKPLTWAITLTRNKAIDRLRRVQRRHRLQDDAEREALVWHRLDASSGEVAVARETSARVRTAVIQLSAEQRHAIELAFFSGLTQQQIADQLDEPLGTIKARIRRGLTKLRRILSAHPDSSHL